MILGELLDSCASTNDLARQRGLAGAPHGTWVSARVQTAGRGRLGRQWQSQSGNLFLSIVLKPASMSTWTWIPLLGAVSVAELLQVEFSQVLRGRRLTIKWPNDLWLEGRKLGGILCESVSSAGRDPFVILGLGLNCGYAPEGLDQPTAALEDATLADAIREKLAAKIAENVRRLDQEGSAWLRGIFEKLAAFPAGSQISWRENASPDARRDEATVVGLGDSGELRVILADGSRKSLFAEDISGVRGNAPQS